MPKNEVQLTRESLNANYIETAFRNPLLGRIAGELKTLNWTEAEIAKAQLIVAVASNASLQKRLTDLEKSLQRGV